MNAPFPHPLSMDAVAERSAQIVLADIDRQISETAALFVARPWRANHFLPGADQMSAEEVIRITDRILAFPIRLHRRIGFLALRRAADHPQFGMRA